MASQDSRLPHRPNTLKEFGANFPASESVRKKWRRRRWRFVCPPTLPWPRRAGVGSWSGSPTMFKLLGFRLFEPSTFSEIPLHSGGIDVRLFLLHRDELRTITASH